MMKKKTKTLPERSKIPVEMTWDLDKMYTDISLWEKDFKSLAGNRIVEETIEVKVRNHKNASVEVMVYEHPWRWTQWEILNANGEWEKVDQTTIKFPVKLGKDQEKTVRYTIRYSW